MKKIIIFGLVLIFSLTGCGFNKNKVEDKKNLHNEVKETVVNNMKLVDWLKNGKSVECEINLPEGKVLMQVKNSIVRMEGLPYMYAEISEKNKNDGISLMSEDWIYMWSGDKGTKINLKELEALTGEKAEENVGSNSWEEMANNWEGSGQEYKCQNKNLADELFTPPSNVDFVDMAESLAGMQNAGRQLQKIENGEVVNNKNGESPNLEEIKKQFQGMSSEEVEEQLENMNLEELMREE